MLDFRLSSMGFLLRLWISFSGSFCVGVVFFPSLPFMGVMLFPSSWLGNASGRGGGVVHSLRLTPCFPPVFLPLFYTSPLFFSFLLSFSTAFSSASSSFSLSPLFPSFFFFSSPPSCLLFILSFSFVSLPPLFFFEGTVCIECFSRCKRGHH